MAIQEPPLNGICPLITQQVPVQTQGLKPADQKIIPVSPVPDIATLTFRAPCLGSECQLWVDAGEKSGCAFRRLTTDIAMVTGAVANTARAVVGLSEQWKNLAESRKQEIEK